MRRKGRTACFGATGAGVKNKWNEKVMHMVTVMIVGLAMGSTVTIGRAVGAKELKRASLTVGNTISLFMGVSVVLTALLLLLVKPIVAVMATPQEAVTGTVTYLTICFIGIPFITAYNIISSIFRGLGDSKSPMYFIAVACGVNILLDYVFIGGLHLGAAGAALGTTLSQTFSVVTQFVGADVVGLFTADATVVAMGEQYIRSYIWDCAIAGIHFCFSGYFCAYGMSGIPFLYTILSIICVRVPGAYFASLYFPDNLYPMGLAAPGGSLLSVIVCLIAFAVLRKRRDLK